MIEKFVDRLEWFYGPLPQPPTDPFALYVWEVLGVHTTSSRRDAAMNALRRIPALTPDAMGGAARTKLEGAVGMAGPYREERLRALVAGVEVFRRHRDLPEKLRAGLAEATASLDMLPHLTGVSKQWMLVFGGGHTILPADPHLTRVVSRLGVNQASAVSDLGDVLTTVQRAALYLAHHGRVTCLESDPLCHVCPLRRECPFASGAVA
jgi:endonuclease III